MCVYLCLCAVGVSPHEPSITTLGPSIGRPRRGLIELEATRWRDSFGPRQQTIKPAGLNNGDAEQIGLHQVPRPAGRGPFLIPQSHQPRSYLHSSELAQTVRTT